MPGTDPPYYTAYMSSEEGHGAVCIDVAKTVGSFELETGDWIIDWSIAGIDLAKVKGRFFKIKDSHPGDTCWEARPAGLVGSVRATDIPAPRLHACEDGSDDWTDPTDNFAFVATRNFIGVGNNDSWRIDITVRPPYGQ